MNATAAFLPPCGVQILCAPRRTSRTSVARPTVAVPRCTTSSPRAERASSALSNATRVAAQLRADLPVVFKGGCDAHYELYTTDVEFEDPLTKFRGIARYRANIAFLTDSPLFTDTELHLYDVQIVDETLVRTRWMLRMTARFPWRPLVSFTGTSDYVLNDAGKVVRHVDCWDSLEDSHYFSRAALSDLVGQIVPGRGSATRAPRFRVLRRTREFEIRNYERFGLAERAGDDENCILFVEQLDEGMVEGTAPQVWMPAIEADDDAPRLETVAVVPLKNGADSSMERKKLVRQLGARRVGTAAGGAFVVQYRPGVNSDPLSRELWIPLSEAPLSARESA